MTRSKNWRVTVSKHILEGGMRGNETFVYEVVAKDRARAIRREREQAIAAQHFDESTIDTDWRWKRLVAQNL